MPFPRQDDLGAVAEVCQSFAFDNGAFSVWKRGSQLDVDGYMKWTREWSKHPSFDWSLIPDVIDGSEASNDDLVKRWEDDGLKDYGVPVWHLHESIERLSALACSYRTVALGSSGQWSNPGSNVWWMRMNEVMNVICDDLGRPACRLHGLRMLDPSVFTKLPLSSADSTNAAVNSGSIDRFGIYKPPTASQRANVIASRIEAHNSSPIWIRKEIQNTLEL